MQNAWNITITPLSRVRDKNRLRLVADKEFLERSFANTKTR